MNPAIIIPCFNRPISVQRLLDSLTSAHYPSLNIDLIISVDFEKTADRDKVVQIVKYFEWNYGSKQVIIHTSNLGLREHILRLGDLTDQFGSIIMLEDDLIVGPYFYLYAQAVLKWFKNDDRIGGISLYNHVNNIWCNLPFVKIEDGFDIYFLQIASSWGQAWTKEQWNGFKMWYKLDHEAKKKQSIPELVSSWPESSWLKHYIEYLQSTEKYFAYPKTSQSTNFSDSGTHIKKENPSFQSPLSIVNPERLRLPTLDDSLNIYDSFFELKPSVLRNLGIEIDSNNTTIDFYSTKNIDKISTRYLISCKKIKYGHKAILCFGMDLKPMILNLKYRIAGNEIRYCLTDSFVNEYNGIQLTEKSSNYFFGIFSFTRIIELLKIKIIHKILY